MSRVATTTPTGERPLRADARRNRERILAAAREVFGAKGQEAQMDDVAAQAGVGVGTVYRHFPTKTALMGAIAAENFAQFAANAREAYEQIEDPWESLAVSFRRTEELMGCDAGVQYLLLHTPELLEYIEPEKVELDQAMSKLMTRAKRAGVLRKDFEMHDFGLVMCGLCSTMSAAVAFNWRRHLEILLAGLHA